MFPIIGSDNIYITQAYGLTDFAKSPRGRALYKRFPGGIHPGYDFGTGGKNLVAVALFDGEVVSAKMDGGWGNHVEYMAPDGFRRQYCHLQTMMVKVGDKVKRGSSIGTVGTTGASSGIHLHYGKRRWVLLPYPHYEYADPTDDFKGGPLVTAPMPTHKIIKGNDPSLNKIYVFNGQKKFLIPDIQTLKFFFPKEAYELVSVEILEKIPDGDIITSVK